MRKIFLLAAGMVFLSSTGFASEMQKVSGYSLNPSLLEECTDTTGTANDSPLLIRTDEKSTAVHLLTETSFSPYLGASGETEAEEEDASIFNRTSEGDGSSLSDYRLEAGFACLLNDMARLNVGYRFSELLPALADQSPALLDGGGDDLRISLDFKLPF